MLHVVTERLSSVSRFDIQRRSVGLTILEVAKITIMKRSKKGKNESRRGEDEPRKELAPGVELMATQDEEGMPNKITRMSCKKKVFDGEKTESQLQKKLNLEPISTEANP